MKQRRASDVLLGTSPLLVAFFHLVTAWTHGGPVAVPDVPAYLNISQRFWGAVTVPELPYHPGYGLLLGVFGFLEANALHTVALCVNALLAGLVVWMTQRLMRHLGASTKMLWVGVAIACLHPSVTHSSRVAWSEVLLVALLLCLALLIGNPDVQRWGTAAFLAGLVPVIHPRGIVITLALIIVGSLSGQLRRTAAAATTGLSITALALQATDTWQIARADAAQQMVSEPGPLATGAGQWLAFTATTAGLGAIGLLVGLMLIGRRHQVTPAENVLRFLALSATAMFVLGAWVLAGSPRADTLLYGRYIDPWVVPITVAVLCRVAWRTPSRRVVGIAAVLVVVSFLITVGESDNATQSARGVMTASLRALWVVTGEKVPLILLLATSLSLGGLVCLRRYLKASVVCLLLVALVSTVLTHTHLRDVGQIADGQMTAAEFVPSDVDCLSHDRSSTKSYAVWLYRLQLPKIEHRVIDVADAEAFCGGYVIAGQTALRSCAGALFIHQEPRAEWGLWHQPRGKCN